MMAERYKLGLYWLDRKQSLPDCSKCIFDTLNYLQGLHPEFSTWYEKGYSKNGALESAVDINYEHICNLTKSNKDDTFENLGYNVSLWNGKDNGASVGISFRCGAFSPRTPNSLLLNFSSQLSDKSEFYFFNKIIKKLIEIWDPDKGRLFSSNLREKVTYKTTNLQFGWITYFSKRFQQNTIVSHPPFDVNYESYGDFLVVTKDLFSSENREHIKRLQDHIDQTHFKSH